MDKKLRFWIDESDKYLATNLSGLGSFYSYNRVPYVCELNNLDVIFYKNDVFSKELMLYIKLFDIVHIKYVQTEEDYNFYINDSQVDIDLNQLKEYLSNINKNNKKYMELVAINDFVENKEGNTYGHNLRVAYMAYNFSKYLGFDDEELNHIYICALLHDIGKVAINDNILSKKTELTDEEYEIIKKHTEVVDVIVPDKNISKILRHHHEQVNGKGYPDKLVEEEIPIECKILSIIDSYDAMTSNRVYSKPTEKKDALIELKKNSNIKYNEDLVNQFIIFMQEEY